MKKLISLILLSTAFISSFSQDIKSVTLSVNQISSLTFEGKVNLYVDSTIDINRPILLMNWGVHIDSLFLSNQTQLPGSVTNKEYTGVFTYPSSGVYNIVLQDSFRIAGISNISNSGTQEIKIGRQLIINPILGFNNSVVINPVITFNTDHYSLNPSGTDSDNDSLYFTLVPCFANTYTPLDSFTINHSNGIIQFYPNSVGMYSICYKIEEWRLHSGSYFFIGYSTDDLLLNVEALTGMDDLENNTICSLYPNPSTNQITLELSEAIKETTAIQIKNTLGQIIKTIPLTKGNKQLEIDVSDLPKGFYFVQMQSGNRMVSKKFIKQ